MYYYLHIDVITAITIGLHDYYNELRQVHILGSNYFAVSALFG